MEASYPEVGAGQSRPARRSLWLIGLSLALGTLTVIVGFGVGLVGWGFANATASGTGAAAIVVGAWTLLAGRNLHRRPATLLGLTLAWVWLVIRVAIDLPGTLSSVVLLVFMLPAWSIPFGLAWLLLTGLFLATIGVLIRRAIRAGKAQSRELGVPRLALLAVGPVLKVSVLIAVTLLVPQAVWSERGKQINRLARQYAPLPKSSIPLPVLGACCQVFLGYDLTEAGPNPPRDRTALEAVYARRRADAEADLASIAKAGARQVRLGASGDQLLAPHPDQERLDDDFVTSVRHTGMQLVLVDTQHPKVCRKRKLDWSEFCRFQGQRIEYYARRYHPEVYFVVCEPMTYHQFALTRETRFSAEAWAAQLTEMCRRVKAISPATSTGICLLVGPDHEAEWEVWTRMRNLPQLDILSVEIYGPEQFQQTEARLAFYGHPKEFGKRFWIAETYNGWALCRKRRWDQDAAWIGMAENFGRHVNADTVLVWTFGSFVPGGNFLDYGSGRLARAWGDGTRLSRVGEAFAAAASRPTPSP